MLKRLMKLKPKEEDHLIMKRRDSAFLDTELRMWLQSFGINVLVFCGVDTSICVETSIRDAFNLGYDIILISDATASGIRSHYETTLTRVSDYYGLQMSYDRFAYMLKSLDRVRREKVEPKDYQQQLDNFIKEFGLLDFRNFRQVPIQSTVAEFFSISVLHAKKMDVTITSTKWQLSFKLPDS